MAFSIVTYFSVAGLFWKDGEPKIIFWGITLFWLSISIKLFYAVYAGVSYESLSTSKNIVETTYSALFAFIAFSVGMYFTTKKIRNKVLIDFSHDFGYSSRRIFYLYAASMVSVPILIGLKYFIGGTDQIVYALLDMKLGFIFMLVYAVYKRKDNVPFVIGFLLVEITLSFFSIFSQFKDILFATIVALLAPRLNLSFKNVAAYAALGIVTIYLLFTWQLIKDDYRSFLNKDSKEQVIKVSQEEALEKLQELATEKNNKKNEDVIYSSIDRLSYIEFYSESRLKVPLYVPYENGKLWAANIAHVLFPRFFFPDKGTIDDSQMVNKYCFKKVQTARSGVSFSLGFIAESYIDFGPAFMYIVVLLVGCLIGFIYSLILKQSINSFWAFTMALPLYEKISCNGTAGSKILGGVITYYISFLLFRKYLMKPLDNYLRHGSFSDRVK